jgi:BirA family biotin operon repressor/biotin-[acetyl-CoA-carboxylase] ligase
MWFVTSEQTAGRGTAASRLDRAARQSRQQHPRSHRRIAASRRRWALPRGWRWRRAAKVSKHRSCAEIGGIGPYEVFAEMAERRAGGTAKARRHPAGSRGRRGNRLAVVVGIGTNVVAAPEGTPTPATSLAGARRPYRREDLFAALSDAWVEFRGIWDNGRGFAEIRGSGWSAPPGSAAGRDPDRRRDASRARSTPSMKPAA